MEDTVVGDLAVPKGTVVWASATLVRVLHPSIITWGHQRICECRVCVGNLVHCRDQGVGRATHCTSLQGLRELGSDGSAFNPQAWLPSSPTPTSSQPRTPPANSTIHQHSSLAGAAADSCAMHTGHAATCPMHADSHSSQAHTSDDGRSTRFSRGKSVKTLAFAIGPRGCVGAHFATNQLMTGLIILAREIKQIHMSSEEKDRPWSSLFGHPTGMPGTLVGR